jgi:hypothetical protein
VGCLYYGVLMPETVLTPFGIFYAVTQNLETVASLETTYV